MKTQTVEDIFHEIDERFSEQFEQVGPGTPSLSLYGIITTKMLLDERNKVEYLRRRLDHYEHQNQF